MIAKLAGVVRDKRVENLDPDSVEFLVRHKEILSAKPAMRDIFSEFYGELRRLDHQHLSATGQRIEVGAGVSFFKSLYPDVIVTDIKPAEHLDQVMDALNLPVPDASVRVIYGINCFHHFPDIPAFFREMDRVLPPGGGVLLIEPYHGLLASILYRYLFSSETFDVRQTGWERGESSSQGAMTGANQALSSIVFRRDAAKFAEMFPQFEIVHQKPLKNYLRYLLSGGLNFNQLLPNWCFSLLRGIERLLTPIEGLFALHHVILIRKKKETGRGNKNNE